MLMFFLAILAFVVVGAITMDQPAWKTSAVIILTILGATLIRLSGVV